MTNNELSSDRILILGIAMFSIMLFHNDYITSIPYIGFILKKTGYLGVDIFLFISGFGIAHSLSKNSLTQYYFNRFIRIIPACIIAGGCILLADQYLHVEKSKAPTIIKMLSFQKWYIQAILVYYMLAPYIKRQTIKYGVKFILCVTIVSLILSIFIPNVGFIKSSWILNRFPIFCIGIYIGLFDFPKPSRKAKIFQSICLAVSLALLIFVDDQIVLGHIALVVWGISIPLVTAILGNIFRKINKSSFFYYVLTALGTFSLEIYLVHEYIYWYSYTVSNWILSLFLTLTLIFGSVYLLYLSSKYVSTIIKKWKYPV